MLKDTVIRVRVPSSTKKDLEARAEALGMNLSEYVRLTAQLNLLSSLTQQQTAADARPAPAR